MNYYLFLGFIFTSIALIVVPGPNVLVIVSTSITHGPTRGLQTVLGTSSAMIIQLLIAAFGTTWLVASISGGFIWLRWLGVAYLVYLGISYLLKLFNKETANEYDITTTSTYIRGFIVSLTNPKTILFFSAFLPQFVSQNMDYTTQILALSVIFLILATLLDSLYAILAGHLCKFIQGHQTKKIEKGMSGILYLGAGIWLAAMKRL